MSEAMSIGVIVGSLRKESFSRRIAKALIERAPKSLSCEMIEIGDLNLYNEDLDHGAPPPSWTAFRDRIRAVDAILFVTPEYNRSIPGCLKNALDVGSRPEGENVFDAVPAAVVSVTPYKLGAFGANHATRQTFVFLNMPVMQQPEAYVGNAGDLVGSNGEIRDPETGKLFEKFMSAFATWTRKNRKGASASPDFEAFMQRRKIAAGDYVNGDATSLSEIVAQNEPATFFPPAGEPVSGAANVARRYESDAKSFERGGTTKLEVLQSGAADGLAFWTGFQHAEAKMSGEDGKVPMTLRITEVFRIEHGDYKLVHRHADFVEKKVQRGARKDGAASANRSER